MEMKQGVFQQQRQKIALSSQVIQSLKLLQFGQLALNEFLKEQEARNPLIKVVTGTAGTGRDGTSQPAPDATGGGDGYGRVSLVRGAGLGPQGMHDGHAIENLRVAEVSLRSYLRPQVGYAFSNPVDRIVALEIVESLDDDGYFRRRPDDVAGMLGVDESDVLRVLGIVQRFEPAGVAGRTLAECLRLQLADRDEMDEPMTKLLENLDLLGNCELKKLSQLCGLSQSDLLEMVSRLRSLDPRPGHRFLADPILPALPDVQVDVAEDGAIAVVLNTSLMPRILVDREYYAKLRSATRAENDTKFVIDCMKDANWLERNIDQRAQTILQVATEIVKHQRAFFDSGVRELKPLYLREIAEALGLHESTVCRATANKYIMTPHGMFAMRHFFVNAMRASTAEGEISSDSIRQKIKAMIAAEPADDVLSDNAIMATLRQEGVYLARRTVSKYREMLNIPTSQKRKRIKRLDIAQAATEVDKVASA